MIELNCEICEDKGCEMCLGTLEDAEQNSLDFIETFEVREGE